MITAIILHYQSKRFANLPVIIRALREGNMAPDEIIVWNNGADKYVKSGDEIVIDSSKNFGPLVRYSIALTAKNDHILFCDDDYCVGLKTVSDLYHQCSTICPQNTIVGPNGINLGKTKNPYIDRQRVIHPSEVDVIDGFLHMTHKRVIVRATEFLIDNPDIKIWREDDILLSMVNKKHGKVNWVVPTDSFHMPSFDDGLCDEPQHYNERDAMCRRLLR